MRRALPADAPEKRGPVELKRTPEPHEKRPTSIVHVHAARCGYHYIEELALYMYGLTTLERQVGHLMLQGLLYQQIATRLFRSESAIKSDARRIFMKTCVKDRRSFERHIHALVESI